MNAIRGSFSGFKKDVKHRFKGKKHAPDEIAPNTTRGRAFSSDSLLRPDSRALASGHDGEGPRTNSDTLQAHLSDRSPQSEPVPAREGYNSQKREVDVDEKEAAQGHSGLESDIKVAEGGRPDQGAHLSPSSPSLPHKAEPDSE